MPHSARHLTRCAVLTALALALSVAEGLVPLALIFPLPGLKLGLANLVTVYALCRLSGREALLILVCRCVLGALVGGRLSALAFSLSGGLLALGVMAVLLRLPRAFPLRGIHRRRRSPQYWADPGRDGGAGHAGSPGLSPPLLLCSLITGAVTATACILLVQRVPVPGPS